MPEIMCSEIAMLINRGIHEVRKEADKKTIFEASLIITNVTLGTTIDTLKKFLTNFKNEMYTERGKNKTQFQVHFYKKARARDACSYCQTTPGEFSNCYMQEHDKDEKEEEKEMDEDDS